MSDLHFLRGEKSQFFSVGEIIDRASHMIEPFGPIEKTEIQKSTKYFQKKLKKLQSIAYKGYIQKTRARQEFLFNSDAAKLVSLILSKPKWRKKPSLQDLKKFCSKMNVRQPPNGVVRMRGEKKNDGNYRTIINPSNEIRMQQKIVHLITQAQWGQSKTEYATKGLGVQACINSKTSKITQGGDRWFIETDIRNCFDSYDKIALEKVIPLPSTVVRNSVVLNDQVPIINKDDNLTSKKAARSGLMQGSQCSSYFSSKLIEPVLLQIGNGHSVSYVDNILVTSRTKEEALAIKNALVSEFKKHPAGPLPLKYINIWKLGYHHHFLGYFLLQDYWYGILTGQAKPSDQMIYKGQKEFIKKALLRMETDLDLFTTEFSQIWASRHPIWPGKKNGAEIFELSLIDLPSRLVNYWQKRLVREKHTFSSFAEIKEFAEWVSELLPKDTLYPPKIRKNTFLQFKYE